MCTLVSYGQAPDRTTAFFSLLRQSFIFYFFYITMSMFQVASNLPSLLSSASRSFRPQRPGQLPFPVSEAVFWSLAPIRATPDMDLVLRPQVQDYTMISL